MSLVLKRQGQRWSSSPKIRWRGILITFASLLTIAFSLTLISTGSSRKPHISLLPLPSDTSKTSHTTEDPFSTTTTLSQADQLQAVINLNNLSSEGFLTLSTAGPFVFFPEEVRTWLRLDGINLKFNEGIIRSSLDQAYGDVFVEGSDVWLSPSADGLLEVTGGVPDLICCSQADIDLITTALTEGKSHTTIELSPVERDRGKEWMDSTGATHLIGEFTTYYPSGRPRVTNIHRIAELTRGVVIEPEEAFSLNEHVGERTLENGFVEDGAIVYGVLIQAVGGGISQFATTLFNAAFFAGLDFEEYKSHSIYFQRYPFGREATISWGWPDLKFTNVTPYPIVIWTSVTPDSVTVQFYSQPWVIGEQTGQTTRQVGEECTAVETERSRTWLDTGETTVDYIQAQYRPEGINCDGTLSDPSACLIDEELEEPVELDPRCPNYTPATTTTTTTTTTEAN